MSKNRIVDRYSRRLIALEGKDGAEVATLSNALQQLFYIQGFGCIINRWNSSALFSQISQQDGELQKVSPRTLAVLYAADLAGRLKEIGPALKAGFFVIANQYMHTLNAIALAMGADPAWVSSVLSFAPQPEISLYVKSSHKSRHNGTGASQPLIGADKKGPIGLVEEGFGFYEFCLNFVIARNPRYKIRSFEKVVNGYFDSLSARKELIVVRPQAGQNDLMLTLRKLLGYDFKATM